MTAAARGGSRGGYRLLERIGEGSTAVVHRAVDPYGRTVAVTEPRPGAGPADEATRRRFAREMAVLGRIRSPYVVVRNDVVRRGGYAGAGGRSRMRGLRRSAVPAWRG